ncbi:hypothetical protein MNB_SV-10-333 [hydrothermal vent metagenome]|uniref:DUF3108 domain-containing protein n=1 Tax=hydrothermal vent metagenome TaxID=652676 RepID=A0A1W1CP26_9ZZZZ
MKKTIQYIFLITLILSGVQAKVLDARYSISYGVFGQLGICDAHLETHGNTYRIEINARTTGIVKRLSGNRQEKYISRGHIEEGMLVSDSFRVRRSHSGKVETKVYEIDHQKQKVTKITVKKKKGKVYGRSSRILDFYSKDDLLTLYFNLPSKVNFLLPKTYELTAVGAEKQGGKVTVIVPPAKAYPYYEKTLGKGDFSYLTAIVYQKLFESSRGELMLAIGKDGIAQKAVLKDLILYGDLKAVRIR